MKRQEEMQAAAEAYADALHGKEYSQDKIACMNDYAAGWQDADAHPNWISVEERLPKDSTDTYLVRYCDGGIDICDYYSDFFDYTGENVTRNVTHWMPIVPPKKGGEE